MNNSVVTDFSLRLCSQDETERLPSHDGPSHEGEEEEEDLTGIHSRFRRIEDGAQTQIEVNQVGGVKIYWHPDNTILKDQWFWNIVQPKDRHFLPTLTVLHEK